MVRGRPQVVLVPWDPRHFVFPWSLDSHFSGRSVPTGRPHSKGLKPHFQAFGVKPHITIRAVALRVQRSCTFGAAATYANARIPETILLGDTFYERKDDDMVQPMTTSAMTEPQINRAVEIFRAQLVTHASELSSDAVQHVFGQSDLGSEWLAVLRKRVEMVSSLIIRHVTVDRTQTPKQVLDATGRIQYTDGKVVESMPKGTGEGADVCFFKLGHWISDDDLEKECDLRGLTPADPYSLAAVNEADLAFADEHPNGTHWKDANGRWCFVTFSRWGDERRVAVYRGGSGCGWDDYWFFGGVRKVALAPFDPGIFCALIN